MGSVAYLPTIHVVIVNWNAGYLLANCIRSFESVSADAVNLSRITIVDNCSTDDSIQHLEELASSLPLEIIRNSTNIGFAAACNQGACSSDADFLLFLNPDTRLTSGSLEKPARYLTDPMNGRVGIVGIQLVDKEGNIARTCARRPSIWLMICQSFGLDHFGLSMFPTHFLTEWDHRDTRAVDQVMGAFFFVRKALFLELNGFDERFFVYYEEVDFAVRAYQTGSASVYLSTARAFHHGSGTTDQVKDLRLFYSWRSRILYAYKHFGFLGASAVTFVTVALEPVVRAVMLITKMRAHEIKTLCNATRLLWCDLPNIIRGNTGNLAKYSSVQSKL